MNKLPLVLISLLLILSGSCDDTINEIDLDEDPLVGKVDGEDWEYTGGWLDYSTTSNQAAGKIFNEILDDPCALVNSYNPHLQVAFPTATGTYNLPFINDTGYIKFAAANGGTIYTSSGGFVQIVYVSATELVGYISATFDDNNYVQGSFLLDVCN